MLSIGGRILLHRKRDIIWIQQKNNNNWEVKKIYFD